VRYAFLLLLRTKRYGKLSHFCQQAVCDADARITYFSMMCAGSTHDSFAFSCDPVFKRLREGGDAFATLTAKDASGRPKGFHLVGDEAYVAGETLATPWRSSACVDGPGEDGVGRRDARIAYNFFHSSARITVERSFGILTRRWLILKRPYGGSMEHTNHAPSLARTLLVCVQLVSALRARGARHPTAERARAPCSQHNLIIERGDSKKITYLSSDVSGRYEHEHGHHGARRRNHRGEDADVALHTFLTSPDEHLPGIEGAPAWAVAGEEDYDESLWDPAYVKEHAAGHTVTNDCGPRQATTLYFQDRKIMRPTDQHWLP
jgi:hypothetical protein